MYTLYILKCSDNSLYTGIANDLEARLEKHRQGKGSKYVRSRLPFELVYKQVVENRNEALKLEYRIKRLSRRQKLEFITPAQQ